MTWGVCTDIKSWIIRVPVRKYCTVCAVRLECVPSPSAGMCSAGGAVAGMGTGGDSCHDSRGGVAEAPAPPDCSSLAHAILYSTIAQQASTRSIFPRAPNPGGSKSRNRCPCSCVPCIKGSRRWCRPTNFDDASVRRDHLLYFFARRAWLLSNSLQHR